MAGDWIKMRHDLADDPAVIAIASRLKIDDRDTVVGKLHKLWSWFDRHTPDGNAHSVTETFFDALVCVTGFSRALELVGWLKICDDVISMPNFERHLSKSAKHRALGNERVKRFRNGVGVTKALPEKRREEKRIKKPLTPFLIPQKLDCPEFCTAWKLWIAHRREIGFPLKPTQESQLCNQLANLEVGPAVELITHTITMGWRALRDGNGKSLSEIAKSKNQSRAPTAEDDANWSPYGDGDK